MQKSPTLIPFFSPKPQPLNNQTVTSLTLPKASQSYFEAISKAGRRQGEGRAKDKRYITEYQAYKNRPLTLHYSQQKTKNIAFSSKPLSTNPYPLTPIH